MKKSIYTIALAAVVMLGCSFTSMAKSAAESNRQAIENVIENYKGTDNFDVVKIGGWIMRLAGKELGPAANIRSMIVVDYSDCSNVVKSSFTKDVLNATEGYSSLLEVQDGNDRVTILGNVSEDDNMVSNPMILTGDGELVCFFGTVKVDEIEDLVEIKTIS